MSNIQYLSLETCKSQNEVQIFEIMEFYTGIYTSDPAYLSADVKEFANGIRNEAAEILRSRLEGYPLALLQSTFLARFNDFYKIGNIKYPTKFWEFVKMQQVGVLDDNETYYILTENVGKMCGLVVKIEKDVDKHIETLREIHTDLLAAKFGNGKFVQC